MGKYSLENYIQYPTKIIRPRLVSSSNEVGPGSQVTFIQISWRNIEKEKGVFQFGELEEKLSTSKLPVLEIVFDIPSWVHTSEREYAASFIRKLGSYIDGLGHLQGVIVTTLTDEIEEWKAYREGFKQTTLYINLFQTKLVHYFTPFSKNMGILISCNEQNWIECCEQLTRLRLNCVWKKHPILLLVSDDPCGPFVAREALRWHASYSNVELDLGYKFQLRRLTYPDKVTSGGNLPLRFWLVNVGTAKVYQTYQLIVKLKAQHSGLCHELTLKAKTSEWLLGDIVHNELVRLPDMEIGIYTLYVGLRCEDGSYIRLHIENEQSLGFYHVGEVEIEQWDYDRYENPWLDYYPEGYYPLEDPALPAEE